jgi:hypothetical protein
MATEILTASEVEIKQAMGVLGLDGFADTLLDEIELDRELKISEEQEKQGLVIPLEEAERRMKERFANGYYDRK